jgi:hypothetical protein
LIKTIAENFLQVWKEIVIYYIRFSGKTRK